MYNPLIIEHFSNPRRVGRLESCDLTVSVGNPVCDDKIQVYIKLNQEARIADLRYEAHGCATSVATGSIFCEHIMGKTIDEACRLSGAGRRALLGELEPSQMHCLDLLDTLFDRLRQGAPARQEA